MFLLSGAWQPWDAIEINTIHLVNFDAYRHAHSAFADPDAIKTQQAFTRVGRIAACFTKARVATARGPTTWAARTILGRSKALHSLASMTFTIVFVCALN